MLRALTSRQRAVDIAIAVVLVVVAVAYSTVYQAGYVRLADLAIALGMGFALALRRLSPPLALLLVWFMAVLQMLLRQDPGLADLAVLPVLYSTAAYGTPVLRWLGFASTFLGAALATLYTVVVPALLTYATPLTILRGIRAGQNAELLSVAQGTVVVFVGGLAVFILSWVLGVLTRAFSRSEASREAQHAAENDRLLAEQAVIVEQERNRIARDMHDIVAHSLAVVIAQADGARYLYTAAGIHGEPGETDLVDESLTTIASTARSALADVRVLLGELRHNDSSAPQPGLSALDALADHFRSTGLAVERRTSGAHAALGAPRELAVYRIVQEALTNALRHGDQAKPVTVSLDWATTELWVTVTSTLPAAAPAGGSLPGHGIPGMIERATLAGGSLAAAPSGRLFVVSARLPVPAPSTPAPNDLVVA
ncbi:two-component sensor histidine kinase [Subtercola sp. Z020]|uniref:sensor histidine kinase n=1 Tax=Subtercola sp. Z020 TaxID=2080582 RepID=UPI000CE8D40F|nr:histidine kinase [Subtercola sp. Z020]PPF80293.1 two-component sensor histidine kinase [Subtercola sp. Z020]